MDIKAIETRYSGYRFRSRLEARWAVYLTRLGFKCEYEKEGFLVGGRPYLPDFWLAGCDVWLEIKPTREAAMESTDLMRSFGDSIGPIVLAWGLPFDAQDESQSDAGQLIFCGDVTESSGGSYTGEVTFAICTHCRGPVVRVVMDARFSRGDRTLYRTGGFMERELRLCGQGTCNRDPDGEWEAFRAAREAKSARFEHGESPR